MVEWWEAMPLLQQVMALVGIAGTVVLVIQIVLMLLGAVGSSDASTAGASDFDVDTASADFDAGTGADFDTGGLDVDVGDGPAGFDIDVDAPDMADMPEMPADVEMPGMDAPDAPDIAAAAADGAAAHAHEPVMARMDGAARGGGLRLFTLHGIVSFMAIFGWSGLVMLKSGLWPVLALPIAAVLGLLAMVLIAWLMRTMQRLQQDGSLDVRYAFGKTGTVYLPIYPRRERAGKVNILLQGRYVELNAITDADHRIETGRQVTVVGIEDESTLLVLD